MAEKFVIQGGKSLKGEIEVGGAKNAAFPILAATLLTKEPCVIDNIPLIEDVFRMINILESLGAKISWLSKRKIEVQAKNVDLNKLPSDIVRRFRGSILIIGPLLARFDKIKIPPPGGCLIGARPIDTHLDVFSQVGNKVSRKGDFYYFQKLKPKKQEFKTVDYLNKKSVLEVVLSEFSVTATENVLLFSALSPQKTAVKIADQDYQVQEIVKVLRKMGAEIKNVGPHAFEIKGKKKLKGFKHKIISDPIETGTYIVAALATKGEVTIKKAELGFLDLFLKKLHDFGAKFEIKSKNEIKIYPSDKLIIDKVQSLPYPGLHTDLQPYLGVLSTQTKGQTMIHDPLYEGRLKYLEEINKMGADIVFCDPHRAIVSGPTSLFGVEIPSLDLRAGAALIIAGLMAKGETTIKNIYQIDRGYEKIEEKLTQLGADIKRVEK